MECQISAAPQDNDHRDQQEGIEARAKPKQGRLGGGSAGWAGQQRGGRGARQSRTGYWCGVTGVGMGVMVATPIC